MRSILSFFHYRHFVLTHSCFVFLCFLNAKGCTTSISFVKDVLFPYVLSNLESYLDSLPPNDIQSIADALSSDVDKLSETHPSRKEIEIDLKLPPPPNANPLKHVITVRIEKMMKHDVKATGLKQLQGNMWKTGYKNGQLNGHVYADFFPMLKWCREHSVSVNVYSSGSVGAQKLLFGHCAEGDLCSFFHAHFDTTSGGKKDPGSYQTIASKLGLDPKEIVFCSDSEAELVAARDAGIGFPVMSVRPGNAPLTNVGREFPAIFSLLQLCGSGA